MGTRFLPATKAVPKELLPVVDRPALQYIVEEAARAGLPEVLMVTGRNKAAIEDFFDRTPSSRRRWRRRATPTGWPPSTRRPTSPRCTSSARARRAGLGHAVLQAAAFVGDEPFAVLLGDDLIDARDHLLEHMLAVQAEHGGSVIALLDVGRENIDKYGAVAVEPGDQPVIDGDEVVRDHRPGREAAGRRGAEQPGHHRPLRARAGRSSTCCARPRPGGAGRSS